MKVQRIRLPETDEVSWIVLGDAYLPIEPIQTYLAFLESLGRSPSLSVIPAGFFEAEKSPRHVLREKAC